MTATLEIVFGASMLAALLSIIGSIVVRVGLRRRGVRIGYRGTMPMALLGRCRTLPPSPENRWLMRLAEWSAIAFFVALIGGGITGPMLTGA